ncbi:hypothetical protein [Nostoc sp.]
MTNQTNAPPAVDYAPLELQRELIAMQELTIEDLLTIGQSQVPESQQELHLQLLEKNQTNQLSESDRLLLRRRSPPQASLQVSADYLMLKKAYAYALLKWEGYSIPDFEQLVK